MDTTKAVTHISLCAGYGGIDLGLKRAIPSLRTVAFSEVEAFACANLVAKMEAGCLDAAPIWTDVKTFPWAEFHGKVDILSGGYPCQPFSAAGKRLGKDDPRHLWPWIADGIRVLQPALCFFENVEGHISLGLRDVIGELEESGYRTTWGLFSAAEVGAVHQRKRIFVLAHLRGEGLERHLSRLFNKSGWKEPCRSTAGGCGSSGSRKLAYSNGTGSWKDWESSEPRTISIEQSSCPARRSDTRKVREGQAWPSRPGQPQHEWEPPRVVGLENATSKRGGGQSGDALHQGRTASEAGSASLSEDPQRQNGAAISNHKPAGGNGEPPRVMANASGINGQRRGARVGRGQRGQSDAEEVQRTRDGYGQTKPSMGRDADGPAGGMDYAQLCVSGDNRTDELRLLGNGVVPATAERAFRILSARFI
jgi:DNA (cytosine-5)-methyltransferase 1